MVASVQQSNQAATQVPSFRAESLLRGSVCFSKIPRLFVSSNRVDVAGRRSGKNTAKMTFKLYNNSTQLSQFVVLLVFTPLGILITCLRFVATRRSARKIGMEDWLAAIATLFFVLTNLSGLMAISILNGRQLSEEVIESPLDYKHMRSWDMAGLYFYFAHTLFVKLSVLSLYRRIFGINRVYLIWIYILGSAQTILFVVFCIFQALQCRPFGRYFDLSVPGTCKDEGTIILGGETPNSLVDFAMVILAMEMIRHLQLSSAVKWRLRVLFGLGFLAGTIGFIKIAITYSSSALYALSMVALWTCVQMFVSLLCCCLPVFHIFLPKTVALWNRIYASLRQGSRSRTSGRSANSMYKQSDIPKQLDDDNSIKGLSEPEATHQSQIYALSNLPNVGRHSESPGLHDQRLNAV
ncbi:Wortmanamides biosynthesis cluster protein C [Cladobotryum mycophilum]|uniref:Wortmanamides biosynthesis cluster protein C n=1 Tax=Cladobotryum mycophilum TaxID=491253 RepID=A0ABR0SLN2_9HYPO